MPRPNENDDRLMDLRISVLLRVGTALSAVIILIGGVIFIFNHGLADPNYRVFRGIPSRLTTVSGIYHDALQVHGMGIIQLGLLVLIATPVARVFFSVIAFWMERDYLYVTIAALVLTVLFYSLFFHGI